MKRKKKRKLQTVVGLAAQKRGGGFIFLRLTLSMFPKQQALQLGLDGVQEVCPASQGFCSWGVAAASIRPGDGYAFVCAAIDTSGGVVVKTGTLSDASRRKAASNVLMLAKTKWMPESQDYSGHCVRVRSL